MIAWGRVCTKIIGYPISLCLRLDPSNRTDGSSRRVLDLWMLMDLSLVVPQGRIGLRTDLVLLCIPDGRMIRRQDRAHRAHDGADVLLELLCRLAIEVLAQRRAGLGIGARGR